MGGAPEKEDYSVDPGWQDLTKGLQMEEEMAAKESTGIMQNGVGTADVDVGGRSVGESKTIFVKENVSIHPTQSASGRINGRIMIVQEGHAVFLTWVPYDNSNGIHEEGGESQGGSSSSSGAVHSATSSIMKGLGRGEEDRGTLKERHLYAIRAVSMSEMRAIRRHTPPIGWQYIIIVLNSGLAFPPLYFQDGGVRALFSVLKQHTLIVRSQDDSNVYLVNDSQDPLLKSLSSLKLSDFKSSAPLSSPTSSTRGSSHRSSGSTELPDAEPDARLGGSPVPAATGETPGEKGSLIERRAPRVFRKSLQTATEILGKDPKDVAREVSMNVLGKFSLVTRFARDLIQGQVGGEDRELLSSSNDFERMPFRGIPDPALENNSLPGQGEKRLTVADPSLSAGKETSSSAVKQVAAQEVATGKDISSAESNLGSFEIVEGSAEDGASPALVSERPRPPPVTEDEWRGFLDGEGRVANSNEFRRRVFQGGVDPSIRKEVWKFLLGYFPLDSTYEERLELQANRKTEYDVLKNQWQSVSANQAKRFGKFRERCSRVEKDVVRTDRTLPFYEGEENANVEILRRVLITYSFYNFDLGYCQGMSDLLSPILFIMEDEVDAFWSFVAFMETMAPNFDRDQNGMHQQLLSISKLTALLDPPLYAYLDSIDGLNFFFCFRWLLIHFKREFEYDDVLRLWEVLWSKHLSDHFHLFVCMAVLKRFRRNIMDAQMEFDVVLKFVNDLSGKIDLESTLRDAEALCTFAGDAGVACMPPPPPPPLDLIEGPDSF